MTPHELLAAVVDYHNANRPTKWIARALGKKPYEVSDVLRFAGLKSRDVADLDKYDQMERLVREGVSHAEILRTIGAKDNRMVSRWFPGTAWPVGGAGAAAEVREANRMLRELDRTGRVQQNRDSGMRPRKDVL